MQGGRETSGAPTVRWRDSGRAGATHLVAQRETAQSTPAADQNGTQQFARAEGSDGAEWGKHPTSNAQHPTLAASPLPWMLEGGRWRAVVRAGTGGFLSIVVLFLMPQLVV